MGKIGLTIAFAILITVAPSTVLGQAKKPVPADKVRDPVCKLWVARNPELSVRYRGKTYYFCMKADAASFKKSPEKYLKNLRHSHPRVRPSDE